MAPEKKVDDYENRYSSREVHGMDVIDLCKHWDLNFNEGSILKYLLRKKGQDISDMAKIIDFATREHCHLVDQEKLDKSFEIF
jgi:hypothetical protein